MTLRMAGENRWNDPDSHITLAARLQKAIPNSYVLDQYKHRGNPLAHFESTGEEIVTAERFFQFVLHHRSISTRRWCQA